MLGSRKFLFMYMKKNIILTMLIISLSFLLCQNVLALGQMSEPIVIENALRGEDYQEIMMIVNTENQSIGVDLVVDGDIEEWTKFYKLDDLENPIEDLLMTSGENKNVSVIFSIPDDMPNGEYAGAVAVIRKPSEISKEEGSSVSLAQRIDREVTIIVGGEEIISFEVSVIPKTYDIKKGDLLNTRLIYDNQGNISIKPQVDLKIFALLSDTEKKLVHNAIYPYPLEEPRVKPGSQYEIPGLELPTSNLDIGRYIVEIDFLHNNEIITEEDFKFSIKQGGLLGLVKGISIGKWQINWWMMLIALILIVAIIVISVLKKKKKKSTNLS